MVSGFRLFLRYIAVSIWPQQCVLRYQRPVQRRTSVERTPAPRPLESAPPRFERPRVSTSAEKELGLQYSCLRAVFQAGDVLCRYTGDQESPLLLRRMQECVCTHEKEANRQMIRFVPAPSFAL